jgi:hypothetical protein
MRAHPTVPTPVNLLAGPRAAFASCPRAAGLPARADARAPRAARQPGAVHVVCSNPLSGSALSKVQNLNGAVTAFGYPSATSFASEKVASLCNTMGLPMGNGGNAIGLAYNGQLIDAVRARARARGTGACPPRARALC